MIEQIRLLASQQTLLHIFSSLICKSVIFYVLRHCGYAYFCEENENDTEYSASLFIPRSRMWNLHISEGFTDA
jgi:hypothetical protein